jgi:hypothetical protein
MPTAGALASRGGFVLIWSVVWCRLICQDAAAQQLCVISCASCLLMCQNLVTIARILVCVGELLLQSVPYIAQRGVSRGEVTLVSESVSLSVVERPRD